MDSVGRPKRRRRGRGCGLGGARRRRLGGASDEVASRARRCRLGGARRRGLGGAADGFGDPRVSGRRGVLGGCGRIARQGALFWGLDWAVEWSLARRNLSEQLAELQRRYNNRFGADSRQLYNPPAPHDAPTTSVSKLDEEAQRKNDAKAAYVKANELAGSGNCEQAIPLYDTANSLVPGTAPKYKKAVCLDLIGKRVEAKASYDVVVATGASSDSNMNAAMIAQARNRSSELSTNDTDAGVVGAAPPLVPEY
jgi:hypothetical protein